MNRIGLELRSALGMQGVEHEAARLKASLAILVTLGQRAGSASICPSEAARACSAEHWREWLAAVRSAALELEERGVLRVTQRGCTVDGRRARGALRYVRGPAWSDLVPNEEERG